MPRILNLILKWLKLNSPLMFRRSFIFSTLWFAQPGIKGNLFVNLLLYHIVQQQRVQIFGVSKPAVQHLSTCLELFSGISRSKSGWWHCRKWGRAENLTLLYTYPIFRKNICLSMIFASFSLYHNVGPVKSNIVVFSFFYPSVIYQSFHQSYISGDKIV